VGVVINVIISIVGFTFTELFYGTFNEVDVGCT
jgi:hypothetical protein